jgi:hypothetical protein
MGKYCTDCAGEIEKAENDMMSFQEVVRCKKCLGAKEGSSGFGGFGKMGDGGFGDGNIGTKSKST